MIHRYEAPDWTVVTITDPWPAHSGNIPPPFVEYSNHGVRTTFVYVGSDEEDQ